MNQCLNCATNNLSKGRNKFCSKQCSKDFFNKKNSKKYNGWIPKYILEKENIEKNRKLYFQYSEQYTTFPYIKENFDIDPNRLLYFCKNELGLDYRPVVKSKYSFKDGEWYTSNTNFYSKELLTHIDIFKSGKLPDGYISRSDLIQKLGVHEITYIEYVKKYGEAPSARMYRNQKIFPEEAATLWIEEIKNELKKHKQQRNSVRLERMELKRKEKELKKLNRKERIHIREEKKRADILKRKQERQLASLNKEYKYLRKQLNKEEWEIYEGRLKRKLSKHNTNPKFVNGIEANNKLHLDHQRGTITNMTCNTCSATKPYYLFYADFTYKNGRRNECKDCSIIKNGKKISSKNKNEKTFISGFTTSIKMELYKKNNQFLDITSKEIWDALPYSKQDLLQHVQSLFLDWMSWENNGHPKYNKKTWQLDHIKPKIHFQYLSMKDEQFLECWGLSNLKPIEAFANLYKRTHNNLKNAASSILRHSLKTRKEGKRWNYFFKHPLQTYIEHLEKNFCEGMSWENHGDVWHIDHIIPCSALPCDEVGDENFQIIWNYENLIPKFASENLSKGSKYNEIKYYVTKE